MRAEAFASACAAGKSGVAGIQGVDTTDLKTSAVAQVRGFEASAFMDPVEARRVPRMVPMAIAASREALESAGMRIDPDDLAQQRSIGVSLGTGGGGIAFVEEQY